MLPDFKTLYSQISKSGFSGVASPEIWGGRKFGGGQNV